MGASRVLRQRGLGLQHHVTVLLSSPTLLTPDARQAPSLTADNDERATEVRRRLKREHCNRFSSQPGDHFPICRQPKRTQGQVELTPPEEAHAARPEKI